MTTTTARTWRRTASTKTTTTTTTTTTTSLDSHGKDGNGNDDDVGHVGRDDKNSSRCFARCPEDAVANRLLLLPALVAFAATIGAVSLLLLLPTIVVIVSTATTKAIADYGNDDNGSRELLLISLQQPQRRPFSSSPPPSSFVREVPTDVFGIAVRAGAGNSTAKASKSADDANANATTATIAHRTTDGSSAAAEGSDAGNEVERADDDVLRARAFDPWPFDKDLPCYDAEIDWYAERRQNEGTAKVGFMFQRPLKTGSTTSIGMTLRMLRNVAARRRRRRRQQQVQGHDNTTMTTTATDNSNSTTLTTTTTTSAMCKVRYTHGYGHPPMGQRFANRDKDRSWLWTLLRDPTSRAISSYYFFHVSRYRNPPTDDDFRSWLAEWRRERVQDYYLKSLSTKPTPLLEITRRKTAINIASRILSEYNFIGITGMHDSCQASDSNREIMRISVNVCIATFWRAAHGSFLFIILLQNASTNRPWRCRCCWDWDWAIFCT